jgi:enoyl-CoA hydratase/carnithine racemase
MDLHVVEYAVSDGVGLMTLSRPDRLNAWTTRMARELRWCMRSAESEPDVRVIVLTGAGRGFCAGADVQALQGLADGDDYEIVGSEAKGGRGGDWAGSFSYLLGMTKPVIAAVNGPAAGIGFCLMCFADMRFAARGAKITTSFGRLGLPAEHGVSWVLPKLVGAGRAADLLFSSRIVLAEEAFEMGLVNRVVDAGDLMASTLDYARTMAAEMKRQLWTDVNGPLGDAWQHADARMLEMLRGPDFAEGVAAYTEKRSPRFNPVKNLRTGFSTT